MVRPGHIVGLAKYGLCYPVPDGKTLAKLKTAAL